MPLEKSPTSIHADRMARLADQCVQCGLCLPVCPTYALDRTEAESPRGRIAIAAALARGAVAPTADLREHIDHCLGCLNCEKACPADVHFDELLIETRAMLGPRPSRPRWLLKLTTHARLLRGLRRLGRALAASRWKNRLAVRLAPSSPWRAALETLPSDVPAAPARSRRSAHGEQTLALFPGCVASVEDAPAQQATVDLLSAAGFQVVVLPAFCCGAMDLHDGETDAAERAAERLRSAWRASGARQLISATPGCIGTLRRALPGVEVADPVTLLAERADGLRFRPLADRVGLHLPCSQINVARSDAALLTLLRRVPGLEVVALPRPPYCCGAAGSHMLEFPERAARLREETLRHIQALEPQRLLSSNIGCRLHLASGLEHRGLALPFEHPLTLLARQLESTIP